MTLVVLDHSYALASVVQTRKVKEKGSLLEQSKGQKGSLGSPFFCLSFNGRRAREPILSHYLIYKRE